MDVSFVLAAIRNKNDLVFKKLFVRYYEELVHYAYTYLKDLGGSEDIVQEVFAKLWNDAHKIDIKISISAYLYRMVRNRCLDLLKIRDFTDTSHRLEFHGLYLPEENDPDALTDSETRELYEKILQVADTFPPQMYQVFKLKFLENYEYKQIASEMGISVNTVKYHLKVAKEKINASVASPSSKKLLFFTTHH